MLLDNILDDMIFSVIILSRLYLDYCNRLTYDYDIDLYDYLLINFYLLLLILILMLFRLLLRLG